MMEQKILKIITSIILTTVFSVMLVACGGAQGIRQPLLDSEEPGPEPSVVTDDFPFVRGNYFLVETNCPQDESALQVSQEQEAVFIKGGFTFDDEQNELLKGFVNEQGLVRFFNHDKSSDPNCTAIVDGPVMRGTCTYLDGIDGDTCRFVYSKLVDGFYQIIWNDCESDDSRPLEIQQNDNEVTLIDGFDYADSPGAETHNGAIESGKIVFNIDVSKPRIGTNQPSSNIEYNCDATVSGNILTGRCRDLTMDPATICTFGYDNTLRTAGVDLSDDSLFPEPAISPDVILDITTDISGTYARVTNDCEDDEGSIQIAQDGTSLGFLGGFDYQSTSPDSYAGTMSSNSSFAFSVLGPDERAFCTADLYFSTQGVTGFIGSCDVVDGTSSLVDTCAFAYSRL